VPTPVPTPYHRDPCAEKCGAEAVATLAQHASTYSSGAIEKLHAARQDAAATLNKVRKEQIAHLKNVAGMTESPTKAPTAPTKAPTRPPTEAPTKAPTAAFASGAAFSSGGRLAQSTETRRSARRLLNMLQNALAPNHGAKNERITITAEAANDVAIENFQTGVDVDAYSSGGKFFPGGVEAHAFYVDECICGSHGTSYKSGYQSGAMWGYVSTAQSLSYQKGIDDSKSAVIAGAVERAEKADAAARGAFSSAMAVARDRKLKVIEEDEQALLQEEVGQTTVALLSDEDRELK